MSWKTFFALFFRSASFQKRKVGYGFTKRNIHKWIIMLTYPVFHFFLFYYFIILFQFFEKNLSLTEFDKKKFLLSSLSFLSLSLPFLYNFCFRNYLSDFYRKWIYVYGLMPTLALMNMAFRVYFIMSRL